MEVLYRNDDAGATGGKALPLERILAYEVFELGNLPMLDEIEERYASRLPADGLVSLRELRALADGGAGFEEVLPCCERLVRAIGQAEGKALRHGLWLAGRDAVEELYGGNEGNIVAVVTSDVCVCDLGYDGKLFAYEGDPYAVPVGEEQQAAPS